MTIGKSFYHCISYCLEDKISLTDEQKLMLSKLDNLQHKDRAEVLFYNNCFGNAKELSKQFNDVRKLSSRVEKPVLHISLRLAPGERLTNDQLTDIGRACAEEFKISQNQYICILHKDTREQHIHIVANRVSYDGKAVCLSNNFRRMAGFCRNMELKHNLQEVLSPRVFLPKEQRLIPRHDSRKERLKEHIRSALQQSRNYSEFERKMQNLGYQVLKGRGISFIDPKKVKIKGSEVGFSLTRIERILQLRQQIEVRKNVEKIKEKVSQKQYSEETGKPVSQTQKLIIKKTRDKEEFYQLEEMEKDMKNLLYDLLKPEPVSDFIHPELLKEARGHRKRLKPRR